MRVLLTDGSGLTARQVATQLSMSAHRVDVLTPDPLALTRFTRHVRSVHRVPPYGVAPFAWLDAALAVFDSGGFDVLFPTQEQVAVLSASAELLGARSAQRPAERVVDRRHQRRPAADAASRHRGFLGSNNIDNAARVCHAPSTVVLKQTIGAAATTVSYGDVIGTDLVVIIGSNVANARPAFMKYLFLARQRGAKATHGIASRLPDAFIQNSVGTTFELASA